MLYAVTSAEPRSSRLRWRELDGVGVLFDERREMPQPKREDILAFGRTLLGLAREVPLLPVRYGTVVESETRLDEVLTAHAAGWRGRLEEVAGHVEMLVHWEGDPPIDRLEVESGRDYLMTRVARVQSQREVADGLGAAVGSLVKEEALLTGADSARLACLVHADSVHQFEKAVHEHARETGRQLWCTGPWPPFSFAGEAS